MKKLILIGIIALILLGSGSVLAASNAQIDWWVIGAGGGTVQSPGGEIVLQGTIGQPFTGNSQVEGIAVCSGFWCQLEAIMEIFLPLVLG